MANLAVLFLSTMPCDIRSTGARFRVVVGEALLKSVPLKEGVAYSVMGVA